MGYQISRVKCVLVAFGDGIKGGSLLPRVLRAKTRPQKECSRAGTRAAAAAGRPCAHRRRPGPVSPLPADSDVIRRKSPSRGNMFRLPGSKTKPPALLYNIPCECRTQRYAHIVPAYGVIVGVRRTPGPIPFHRLPSERLRGSVRIIYKKKLKPFTHSPIKRFTGAVLGPRALARLLWSTQTGIIHLA